MDISLFSETLGTTIKIFALMTPPAVLSAFLSGTRQYDARRKLRTACKTSLAIFLLGLALFLFGEHLFTLFDFTLDAFRIGSGVLLLLTGIALINGDGENPEEAHSHNSEDDISVTPLAIPLGMGPASIGAVMVMGASAGGTREVLVGVASLLLASAGMFALLGMADVASRILRKTGIAVLARLTGFLLAAIAAQVIFTGILGFL